MSCSLYRWTEACEGDFCPMDCDLCGKNLEEDGDEVYIHGYIDEIRPGTIIIRNDGGYFGTISDEVFTIQELKHEDEENKQA